jgi:hypothetical protein
MSIGVLAQEDVPTFRALSAIEQVELVTDPDMPVLLIRGTLPTGCTLPVQISKTLSDTALFVDVYQDISIAMICPAIVVPFEIRVPILEFVAREDDTSEKAFIPEYLIVNDQYFGVAPAVDDKPETTYADFTLTPLVRVDTLATAVTYEDVDALIHLVVSGSIPDGCDDPIITRWTREVTDAYDVTIFLSVFRVLADPAACPTVSVPVPYEIEIATNVPSQYSTLVHLGEQQFPRQVARAEGVILPTLDPIPTGLNTMKIPHVIDKIEYRVLESFPMQVHIEVTGYQSDGCNVPVQVVQQRVANTITVEIFRDLPPDAMCPQIIQGYNATIPLSGTFNSGSYTVDVNGTSVTIDL